MSKEKSNLTRSQMREQAFMLLFAGMFGDAEVEELAADNEELFEDGISEYAYSVTAGVYKKRGELDAEISKYLKKGWSLDRISKTSLAVLRLAFYEIKYIDAVPDGVSANEAVELIKKYSIDESGFVNGILGAYISDVRGE